MRVFVHHWRVMMPMAVRLAGRIVRAVRVLVMRVMDVPMFVIHRFMCVFMGVGLLLSAFTASVAAAIGGLRRDEMHATFWSDPARARGRTVPTV